MFDLKWCLMANFENLRLCTAKLKLHRLKFPNPGQLFRVKQYASLRIVNKTRQFEILANTYNELLLLIYVDAYPPPHPGGELVDPVELYFLNNNGIIVSTGTRAGADALTPFEALYL